MMADNQDRGRGSKWGGKTSIALWTSASSRHGRIQTEMEQIKSAVPNETFSEHPPEAEAMRLLNEIRHSHERPLPCILMFPAQNMADFFFLKKALCDGTE